MDMASRCPGPLKIWPPSLQAHFITRLEQQLSISRPPLGLPRRGLAYFPEDVLTAMDSAPRYMHKARDFAGF